jgi:hypothetical protein
MNPSASAIDAERSDHPDVVACWHHVTFALGRLRASDSVEAARQARDELQVVRDRVDRAIDRLDHDIAYRASNQLELHDDWSHSEVHRGD